MLSRVLLSAFFVLILTVIGWAQTGTIKGNVKDGISGEAVIGANIMVAGTSLGAVADINGDFQISNVKSGNYDLIISFISYKTDTFKGVVVYPNQITAINTTITEESQSLQEVVVSGQRFRDTDISIISDIKASQLVVTGISSQQISMSQDRDAAQVVKRIPGVTILGNKFVNVRGLSERYSVVLLNGIIAPSTEVDSRAFAFDLIPSNMIDRMMVYKSGGAELPGDFAGSVINITTKSVVDENSLSINFTGGFRAGTTFKSFNTEEGSSVDWLGFDNGFRDIPTAVPNRNLREISTDSHRNRLILGEAGASFNNNWIPITGKASPDLRTTINFSRSGNIGKVRIGNVTSISLSNTRQRVEQINNYYEAYSTPGQKVGRRYEYNDNRDVTTVRSGVISNFVVEVTPSHIIEFRNFFNQQGTSAVTERTGVEDVQNFDVYNMGMNYTERSIYSGQLSGKHSLTDRLSFNWTYGYAKTEANQPDYKRIRSQKARGLDEPFSVNIAPSASTADGRFFSELNEDIHSQVFNVDYNFNPLAEEKLQTKISVGYYGSQTKRDFRARWFSFNWFDPDTQAEHFDLLKGGFNNVFVRGNLINPEDGPDDGFSRPKPIFLLTEGTNPSDGYAAQNMYNAGYINLYKPFKSFNVSVGSRIEYNQQKLTSEDDKGVVEIDNPITSVLPFVNLSYDLNEKSLLRFAYSKTVNRPNFRELAPFNYYDFDRNTNTHGEDSLKIADIHNIDLRWEKYPSANESITFGVFYKYFKNPIETKLEPGANIIYTYTNALSATSYGAEIDIRKSLNGLTGSRFVDNLSVQFNAAVIKSKVTLSEKDAETQDKERAMQGQSPYIINAGLNYGDVEKGLHVSVSYNVFGKRIFAIGDYNDQSGLADNPTQYEMPRNQIDLTVSKDFGSRFNMKFGVQDILNQKYKLIQDSNSDRKITKFDDNILSYRPGQYVTLGVTYKSN